MVVGVESGWEGRWLMGLRVVVVVANLRSIQNKVSSLKWRNK